MEYSKKKIHSFGKIFGGKSRYARQYIDLFPAVGEYSHYLEPFAGGAGILMNKVRSEKETISDIDENTYNVLYSLKEYGSKVKSRLNNMYGVYSERNFKIALEEINSISRVNKAAAYIAANRMSRTGQFKDFATSNRLRGGQMGDKNAWENFIYREIELTISRLQGVEILNECAFDLIEKRNNKNTLMYLDPPYLHETRVTKKAYNHEFTTEDHIRLLKIITNPAFRGKVFLSGYDSPLYRSYLGDWKLHTFDRPSDAGQTKVKTTRKELVWES